MRAAEEGMRCWIVNIIINEKNLQKKIKNKKTL